MPDHPWFEVDGPAEPDGEFEVSPEEGAFLVSLREHTASFASDDVYGDVGRTDPGDVLVAYVELIDHEAGVRLAAYGVHFQAGRVLGDVLGHELALPESPSARVLAASGTVADLAWRSAAWIRDVLDRPVVLYVWLHERYAYAARFAFADLDETLCQTYVEQFAPPDQARELIAAGHVRGKGWIRAVGLSAPDLYFHVRGDLGRASLPAGVAAGTERGPIGGVWYA
ncbi:hypothetical protein [Embleya sp. MST-111070]|uniref:hypothetical protein n=1 Tax=Embleya sp. MST-111070 TaxID=3398231 RepID=UPI003F734B13